MEFDVAGNMSSKDELQMSTLSARARETATLKRFRSNRNPISRGMSQPFEVAIE